MWQKATEEPEVGVTWLDLGGRSGAQIEGEQEVKEAKPVAITGGWPGAGGAVEEDVEQWRN